MYIYIYIYIHTHALYSIHYQNSSRSPAERPSANLPGIHNRSSPCLIIIILSMLILYRNNTTNTDDNNNDNTNHTNNVLLELKSLLSHRRGAQLARVTTHSRHDCLSVPCMFGCPSKHLPLFAARFVICDDRQYTRREIAGQTDGWGHTHTHTMYTCMCIYAYVYVCIYI